MSTHIFHQSYALTSPHKLTVHLPVRSQSANWYRWNDLKKKTQKRKCRKLINAHTKAKSPWRVISMESKTRKKTESIRIFHIYIFLSFTCRIRTIGHGRWSLLDVWRIVVQRWVTAMRLVHSFIFSRCCSGWRSWRCTKDSTKFSHHNCSYQCGNDEIWNIQNRRLTL